MDGAYRFRMAAAIAALLSVAAGAVGVVLARDHVSYPPVCDSPYPLECALHPNTLTGAMLAMFAAALSWTMAAGAAVAVLLAAAGWWTAHRWNGRRWAHWLAALLIVVPAAVMICAAVLAAWLLLG